MTTPHNGRTYAPMPHSLPGRVVAFFKANPDEILGLDDIVEKFEPARANVHTLLAAALGAGLLMRDRDADGDYVYKAGEALVPGVDIDAVQLHKPAKPKVKRRARPPVDVDPAAVVIEKDVPPPEPKRLVDYGLLLNRMEVDDSAQLPAACQYALKKQITAIHKDEKRRFVVRCIDGDAMLRVWRKE